MTTVWVVQQGEYSDRHIVRVFATEDEATGFVEERKKAEGPNSYDDWDAQEWPLGEENYYVGTIYAGRWLGDRVSAAWNDHPELEIAESFNFWSYEVDEPVLDGDVDSHTSLAHVEHISDNPNYPCIIVRGQSEEHVKKALYDRVAQFKAEKAGIA